MCAWKSTAKFEKRFGHTPYCHGKIKDMITVLRVLNRAETALRPSLFGQNLLSKPVCLVSLFILLICPSCVGSQRCALRYAFSMRALPAKLRKSFIKHANLQAICNSAKAFGSLMHKPCSSIFTRIARMLCKSAKNIVITCEKMWWHAMTMTEVRKNSQNLHLHGPGRFCCALSCTMPFWGECHGQRSWEWLDVAGEAVVASALNWLSWYSDETRMNKHEQWDMVRHGETLWNYQIQHHEARHQAWFCRQNWGHVESACLPEDLPVSVSDGQWASSGT